jgi:cell division protein ZapA (FtsZ GTPase activity inhibitor)
MERPDLLTIRLNIFELQEPLALTIPREHEEVYRKAASQVNAAIKQYRRQFQVTPLEKIISMVSLNFAVKSLATADNQDLEPMLKQLKELDADLKSYLDTKASE